MAREPSTQTRQRILEVALELFGRQGYDRTSLREISERLSFTKAALYYHFKAKEDILRALAGDLLDEVRRIAEAALANPDRCLATRRATVEDLVDLLLANRATAEVLLSEHQSLNDTDIGERGKQVLRLTKQALMPPQPTDEDWIRAAAAVAIIQCPLHDPSDARPVTRDLIVALAVSALTGCGCEATPEVTACRGSAAARTV